MSPVLQRIIRATYARKHALSFTSNLHLTAVPLPPAAPAIIIIVVVLVVNIYILYISVYAYVNLIRFTHDPGEDDKNG